MEQLTKKEEEVMQILWEMKKGFVRDIIAEMPSPKPPHSTVSSVVRILETKGFVAHKAYGKTYEYYPVISKDEYRKFYLKNVVQDYFSDSYKEVLSFFAREENIGKEDLKELMDMIDKKAERDDD
ncbi:BlaI/MecI/CopY family transcriptional regulator [Roseivirga sp. BDSF3-8]|uniref:BlaI/MecI/CopY family transcriptional regulator n=1 Tax=Roseivirga sp. BDSF3-8 TaxID=3241598 RepID=UPI003531D2EA